MMPDITVIVGIDQATSRQLLISAPTWKRHRPEMWTWPWVIFYDWQAPDGLHRDDVWKIAQHLGLNDVKIVSWPIHILRTDLPQYETQREKMVTGFVYVPESAVETEWCVKIDCDSVASGGKPWPLMEWFENDNVLIASGWGYTKNKGGGGTIQEWAEKLERFGDAAFARMPRVGLKDKINVRGTKINMSRIASWICFQNVMWLKDMAERLSKYSGWNKIPVPSHDTVLWYCAERGKYRYLSAKQKRFDWSNHPRMKSLEQAAKNALQ